MLRIAEEVTSLLRGATRIRHRPSVSNRLSDLAGMYTDHNGLRDLRLITYELIENAAIGTAAYISGVFQDRYKVFKLSKLYWLISRQVNRQGLPVPTGMSALYPCRFRWPAIFPIYLPGVFDRMPSQFTPFADSEALVGSYPLRASTLRHEQDRSIGASS